MSFRTKIQSQYRQFVRFFQMYLFPTWLGSTPTKVVVTCLVFIVGVCYIFEISILSTSGYIISSLEKQVATEQNTIQKLQTEIAMNQSMVSIQKRLPSLGMVPVPGITRLNNSAAVARR